MNFAECYQQYYKAFETELIRFCADMNFTPAVLTESMRYSLLSGGKRVRPVLFLAAADCLGVPYEAELNFALALECIHTYSLIHDDLPAMDNDDYRRGRESNHKKFGEANAILAGDALLSYAFQLLLVESGKSDRHLRAALALSRAAGAEGMVAGQSADLLSEGKEAERDTLSFIYEHKTGKLVQAPLVMAAMLAGKNEAQMREYGKNLGILFQITDDILDVKGENSAMGKTLGKDEKAEKLTCVRLYGAKRSEQLADECAANCLVALDRMENADFLREFVHFVRNRNH